MPELDFLDELMGLGSLVEEKPVVLNKTSINMFPNGIDWTQEDILGLSKEMNTYCYPDGSRSASTDPVIKSKLSKNFITATLHGNGLGFYELKDCGDYLSWKEFIIHDITNGYEYDNKYVAKYSTLGHGRVMTAAVVDLIMNNDDSKLYRRDWKTLANIDFQLRLYKDRSFVPLFRFDFDGDVSRYFVINPQIYKVFSAKSTRWSRSMLRELNMKVYAREPHGIVTDSYTNLGAKTESGVKWFIEVTDERELEFYKTKCTSSNNYMRWFIDCSNTYLTDCDVTGRVHNADYSDDPNTDRNKNIFNNFFGTFNPENENIKKEFDTKFKELNDKRSYSYRNPADGIVTIYNAISYMTLTGGTITAAHKRDERAEAMWSNLHWSSAVGHPLWERRGNQIIVTYWKTDASGWRSGSKYVAFVYNTDDKTRYLLTKDHDYDAPKVVVPSLRNGICMNLNIIGEKAYTPELYNDVTLAELFAGTNVEWILNNTTAFDPEFKIDMRDGHSVSKHYYMNLSEQISTTNLGLVPIAILATTGTPVLEQLLKNKLFNLYFATLNDLIEPSSVIDVTRKQHRYGNVKIEYDGSESSLKKMFKMTPDQLKVIDRLTTIVHDDSDTWNNGYEVPALKGALQVLGLEKFNIIDVKTFEKIVEVGKMKIDKSRYCHNAWEYMDRYLDDLIRPLTAGMNIKQTLEFVQKYGEHFQEYRDYLRARTSLMKIATKGTTDLEFNESWYPEKPSAAVKFVYFRPGEYKNCCTATKENFMTDFIDAKYGDDVEREEVRNEAGELTGAIVRLTPAQHICYLHDEASTWVTLYQDEDERVEFESALERVRPFEYTDEETGLSIVAPKRAGDVRNEGAVLSHCVATYVDAIKEGRDNIMFLRRTDMIEAPYFTVEVVPNEEGLMQIRQVHSYRNHNSSYEEQDKAYAASKYEQYNKHFDVLKFLNKWARHFKESFDVKSVKDTYGALCHL